MSHISKVKIEIKLTDENKIINVINNLKQIFPEITVKSNTKIQRALSSNSLEAAEQVDILIDTGNGFEIGLKKSENDYSIVVDKWYWNIHNKKELMEKYINKIQDFYLLEEIKENAEAEGYTVNWTYNNKEDEIEFEMEKW